MEDSVRSSIVTDLAVMIDSHNGGDTTVLDIRNQSSWTDFFVITTATSGTHMKGLYRNILSFLRERNLKPLRSRKQISDDQWLLVDCGDFVIHVMSEKSRQFYELERLWYGGSVIDYSSKSS